MRFSWAIILSIALLLILTDCSQNGCPGGMCPPDHYYANRRNQRRTLSFSSNYNKTPLFRFRGSGTGWSRGSYSRRSSFYRSMEGNTLSFSNDVRRGPLISFRRNGTGWSRSNNKQGTSFYRSVEGNTLSFNNNGRQGPLISFRRNGTGWSRSNYQSRSSYKRNHEGNTLSFNNNSRRPLIFFGRNGTGWSRGNNQNKVSLRNSNIENPGASLSLSKEGNLVRNINSLTYDMSAVRNRQSRFLNKNRIRPGRGGHQEGLWSPQMDNWKARIGDNKKKVHKQKVKTKKLH